MIFLHFALHRHQIIDLAEDVSFHLVLTGAPHPAYNAKDLLAAVQTNPENWHSWIHCLLEATEDART